LWEKGEGEREKLKKFLGGPPQKMFFWRILSPPQSGQVFLSFSRPVACAPQNSDQTPEAKIQMARHVKVTRSEAHGA